MKSNVFIILLCLLLSGPFSFAQNQETLKTLDEDEQMVIEAVALYPKEQREAILTVSTHPEILVRLEKIQEQSAASFTELIEPLDVSTQRMVYDVSRYTELVSAITANEQKLKNKELDEVLARNNYSESVKENARHLNGEHFDILLGINDLYNRSEAEFYLLIEPYDAEVQNAARAIVELPEVLSILNDNISMTVLLGDIYKRDPQWLMHELDSLNTVLAEEKARELQDWKESLESDTQAMNEYQRAAKEFAEEEGYPESQYTETVNVQTIYVHDYWRPYPYWFGYPYWYSYPFWYDYPWWYHWGFYYGPNHTVVIIGMPSTVFVHWHFNHYHHFHHYPHFTDHYFRHYHHHPRTRSSVSTTVRHWERDNSPNLPRNWTGDDEGRVGRIQEYGRFRMDYENKVQEARGDAPTQREFLQQNAQQYPTMRPLLSEKQPDRPVQRPDLKQQPREVPGKVAPPSRPDQKPAQPTREQRQPPDQKEINRGWDYHNNTWDRQKRDTRAPQRPVQPAQPSRKPSAPAKKDAPVQQKAQPKKAPTQQAPRQQKVQPPQQPR